MCIHSERETGVPRKRLYPSWAAITAERSIFPYSQAAHNRGVDRDHERPFQSRMKHVIEEAMNPARREAIRSAFEDWRGRRRASACSHCLPVLVLVSRLKRTCRWRVAATEGDHFWVSLQFDWSWPSPTFALVGYVNGRLARFPNHDSLDTLPFLPSERRRGWR